MSMVISNRRGSVLLFVLSGIAMIAAIGMGMFYMTSTSSLGQVGGNVMNRAHYLALAGKDYATANWNIRSQLTGNEFILSNTERFQLTMTNYQITSTGIVNKDTPFEAKKTIKTPSPSLVRKHFFDSFEDLTKWATGAGAGEVGGHAIATVPSDKALDVTSSAPAFGSGVWSFLQLNTGAGGTVDFTTAWQNAGYCLSHDLQVKITNSQSLYLAGIIFKIAGSADNREFFGISYLKTKQRRFLEYGPWSQADNIPLGLTPEGIFQDPLEWEGLYQVRYSRPAIILWKKQGGTFTWLAYRVLSSINYVVNASYNLVDWSNLQVRLIEAYPLGFNTGGPTPLLHGSVVKGGTSGAQARISGTPIMTAETWSSNTAAGTFTLTNKSGTFQIGENLLVSGAIRAKVSSALGTKTNYIRVYYGDFNLSHTPNPNNNPTDNDRALAARVTTGSSEKIHWPVDDVSNWSSANDYMTLVLWGGTQGSASIPPSMVGKEANAIIKDGSLLTPDSGAINYSGIALHATGNTAASTYFDDFAIQY